MLFLILVVLLGSVLCVEEEVVRLASIRADTVAVISLFMILGLTFSVSLYGIKKLLETTPKQMAGVKDRAQSIIIPKRENPYEVISF